jgi:putative phosphoesterase
MRIGILSDTHDRAARAGRAAERLRAEGAERLIHCGDVTGPDVVFAVHAAGLPAAYVFGNCDHDRSALRAAFEAVGATCLDAGGVLELGDKRVAVTHGDDTRAFRRLLAARPDYLLYGHTHEPLNERDGPTRQINPGALHRARRYTVVVLDLERDEARFVDIV